MPESFVSARGEATPTSNALVTISVQEFMAQQGFVSVVAVVRENSNGYPYITFMREDNVAENIYFSKKGADTVAVGDSIERGFFKPYVMSYAKNADGELRWKISTGSSNRIDAEELF